MVQQIYLAGDDEKLYKVLKPHVESQARVYAKEYNSPYTCYDDFLSRFWEVTWELAEKPYRKTGHLFVDMLDLIFEKRAVDLVREMTPHWPKRYGSDETEEDLRVRVDFKTSEQMDRYVDTESDVERVVLNQMFVETMLSDPCLTEKDRQLLELVYEQPYATYEKLGEMLGVKRQTVFEQMQRIRKKLRDYRPDALYGDWTCTGHGEVV
jgi:RNA polymerase sigma factor (sigma-70 family)